MDSGVYILTPIRLGLKDGLNPYAVSVGVILLILLACEGRTAQRIKRAGILFILAFWATVFMGMLGVFDRWIQAVSVQRVLWVLSLGAAVLFLWVGSRIFHAWWKGAYRPSDKNGTGWIPVFFKVDGNTAVEALHEKEKGQKRVGIIVLSVILGVLGALWNSLWPPDYYVYLAYALIVSGGNPGLATLFFALYSLGYVLFFVVIGLAVLSIHRSHAAVQFSMRRISVIRAVSSAACFAIGVGLIYLSVFMKY